MPKREDSRAVNLNVTMPVTVNTRAAGCPAALVPIREEAHMDFLIEFVGEILAELVLEGGESAASDHRRPRWQRVLVLALLALFFAAALGLITWAGVLMAQEGRIAAAVCMFALDMGLVFFCACKIRKILRTFSCK